MKDKSTGKERLYMAVTRDRLSLPLAVAEENAEIYSIIRRKKERWLKRLEG